MCIYNLIPLDYVLLLATADVSSAVLEHRDFPNPVNKSSLFFASGDADTLS